MKRSKSNTKNKSKSKQNKAKPAPSKASESSESTKSSSDAEPKAAKTSDKSKDQLKECLQSCDLLDAAEEVGTGMYRLTWGSATVVCASHESAVVAIAPMFESLPTKKVDSFCQRILKLNAEMGGTAAFAIQSDGSVVLQSGRGLQGLDPEELKLLLNTVGKFADDYDDLLDKEFYQ